MKVKSLALPIALIILGLGACGGGAGTPKSDLPPSIGTVSPTAAPYPAIAPDVPQVVSGGGPVMDAPKVVAITFPNDPLLADIETFCATLGDTSYWHDTTAEYGVGKLVALPPVRLTEDAPATTTDGGIQAWLRDKLDGTHPELPAPDGNTIYALFYPAATVIDDGGGQTSCQAYGGYHSSTVRLADGTPISYAVLPRCQQAGVKDLETLTVTVSHELIEAVTDPQPLDYPAYLTIDDNHIYWLRQSGGGEVGDMCQMNLDAEFQPTGFPFYVQRTWSNAAALDGRDPCVPSAADHPYFNTTPSPETPPEAIDITQFGAAVTSQGYVIPVGTSKTVELTLYSSDETAGPWTVQAVDTSARNNRPPTLSFALDRADGENGTKIHVIITALMPSSSRSGATTFAIRSMLGSTTHSWLGLVKATAAQQ